MAGGTKQLKRRIKSIANTKKITKAMELVSGAKMRRAVEAVLKSRQFALAALEMVKRLGGNETMVSHELLRREKKTGKGLVILISSDRGLCGNFNTQLFRKLESNFAALKKETPELEFVVVGKRGAQFIKRMKLPLKAFFENFEVKTVRHIEPVATLALDGFLKQHYDRVFAVYTDFRSALRQVPSVVILLPMGLVGDSLNEVEAKTVAPEKMPAKSSGEFIFEPSPATVLNQILPRIFETELYQTILESAASEHSARMMAMRNATDSAAELLDDLVFTYNQIRQGGITKEIIEVSTGASLMN